MLQTLDWNWPYIHHDGNEVGVRLLQLQEWPPYSSCQALKIMNVSPQSSTWSNMKSLGIAALSDATGPEAAPSLSPEFSVASHSTYKNQNRGAMLGVKRAAVVGFGTGP